MKEKDIIALSDAIKLERFKKKKSQEDCAEALGVSVPTYRDYEYNPNKLSLDQAILLGDFLEWNLVEFFLKLTLQNAIHHCVTKEEINNEEE